MHKKTWSVVDTLYWLGGCLVSLGAGLWFLPMGLIAAGGFCLAGAALVDLSATADHGKEDDGE